MQFGTHQAMEPYIIPCGLAQIELITGDITSLPVDAVVNAANSQLIGGGGVDGAIHRAGGPSLMQELRAIKGQGRGCPPGTAVVTGAGQLPAKYVFHAVGPVYRDGKHGEPDILASCYTTCMELARDYGVCSISFPSISTGVYGYPKLSAAGIAISAVRSWLLEHAFDNCNKRAGGPLSVKLVQFSDSDHEIYLRIALAMEKMWNAPTIEDNAGA
jgi:O-acetyl-ADP-ribose deacetylase (regulator of RNase III)